MAHDRPIESADQTHLCNIDRHQSASSYSDLQHLIPTDISIVSDGQVETSLALSAREDLLQRFLTNVGGTMPHLLLSMLDEEVSIEKIERLNRLIKMGASIDSLEALAQAALFASLISNPNEIKK